MKRVPKAVLEAIALKIRYPRILELGLEVKTDHALDYVKWYDLKKALRKHKITKKFGEYFGIQTCFEHGPYAHDVEAVLERIFSGKLIGTQKDWD